MIAFTDGQFLIGFGVFWIALFATIGLTFK